MKSAFSTWIFRIATNICKNQKVSFWSRFSRSAVRLDEPVTDDQEDSYKREAPSDLHNPHDTFEKKHTRESVHKAIMQLPQKHRELIVLADIQELSYEEIQGITAIALGTINRGLRVAARL